MAWRILRWLLISRRETQRIGQLKALQMQSWRTALLVAMLCWDPVRSWATITAISLCLSFGGSLRNQASA